MAELKEQTIEKEFVPYDLALELRNLGFDEHCFAFYGLSRDDYKTIRLSIFQNLKTDYLPDVHHLDVTCDAPLYQQAFRFFRDRYHLIGCIDFHASYKNYMYNIKEFEYITHRTRIETYEEAELECLVKLIEICRKLK